MKKYEHMVELNHRSSKEKVARAIAAIGNMEQQAEKITVAELVLRTELSRAFFYKNEEVRMALDAAMKRQQGMRFVSPRKVILDAAMHQELSFKDRKIEKLEEEVKKLSTQNQKLQKAINRKELAFIKNL